VAGTGIKFPVVEAPSTLVRPIFAAVLPEGVTVTLAIVPSAIVLAFNPEAIQIYPLGPLAHVRVLPAVDRATPATTLRLETAAVE
jgi:hypothetical protein